MKTRFVLPLLVGFLLGPSQAQTVPAAPPADQTSAAAPAAAPAAPVLTAPNPNAPDALLSTNLEPIIPEIAFQEAPLPAVISFLAEHSGLTVALDPAVLGARPDALTMTFTNVTAREALDAVLKGYNLTLVADPTTGTATVAEVPRDLEQSSLPPGVTPPPGSDLAPQPDEVVVESLPIGGMTLQEAITMLSQNAKIDIIFDPRLLAGTNNITTNMLPEIEFNNKTYRQALTAVLNNYNLALLPDKETHIARVTTKPPPNEEPLLTHVVQLKYGNVTNMTTLIQSTLGSRSKVTNDVRTSKLVLFATKDEIQASTNLIEQLDQPTKQVLIEAHLIETAMNPKSVKGIDWSGTLENQNITFGNGFTTGSTITRAPGDSRTVTLPSGRQVSSQEKFSAQTVLETALGNGGFSADTTRGLHPNTAFLNADGVRAVLSFLNTEADSQVLATPRAVTLDNETARLEVSRAFPIFEVTPGAANVPAGAEITYTNLGTILLVTPRIGANSNINLKVSPEVSNIDSVDRQTINGQQNTANVYAIRKIDTLVNIPSGHTLVMGGLISDNSTKGYTKVPLLGDVPGVGLFFRKDSKVRNKANLIIFVTPTIIEEDDFHRTETTFLTNRPPAEVGMEESAWDRGKPASWRKNKKTGQ